MAELALRRGTDADGARPVVSYLTQGRPPGEDRPMMVGVGSGVIDPRERILCDAVIVPVKTDRILDRGRATQVWNRASLRALTGAEPALSVAGV
jgi:hypothetical protein